MRNFLTTCTTMLFVVALAGQSAPNFFTEVQAHQIFLPERAETVTMPTEYLTFSLDLPAMRNHLRSAPAEGSAAAKAGALQLQLPMPNGTMETFRVWESLVMDPALAEKYPMIRTFAGRGITDPTHTVRLGFGLDGFHSLILAENGGSFVTSYATGQTQYYLCFSKSNITFEGLNMPPDWIKYLPMEGAASPPDPAGTGDAITLRGGGEGALVELRRFRFALACTGEYGQTHGGTVPSVLSTLVTAANTLNSVVERDADLRLILIPNNDLLVFTNPDTDPYNNSSMGTALLGQNEDVLNNIVGLSSFDVGHVFTGPCSDVGGVVSGAVCSAGKARGVTCHFGGNVVATVLSIAAHEMGHQLTAGHTFNNCPGSEGQHSSGSAWEPGSGSTIVSYQGVCGSNNIPGGANVHYHGGNVQQYWTYTHNGGGNICPDVVVTSNHSPVVLLPYTDGFFIPISTPFELVASATDEDGDAMTYVWEQIDLGPVSQLGSPVGDAPSFRVFDPTVLPKRVFPRMPVILNNGSEITEVLPTYNRNLTFRCTVRDNNVDEGAGGITWQDVAFKATASAGPFLVQYPNLASDGLTAGQEVEITWDVANTTNDLVKCYEVNIKLSVDGGQTYPHTLVIATPNDGAETVFVPGVTTNNARIRIEASNNIFFDLSNQSFPIVPAAEPGYTLAINPQSQQICVPDNATVQLTTGSVLNFDTPVEFEVVSGLPAGVSVGFSGNPVTPGSTVTATFDMSNVAADGIFEVVVRAVAGVDTTYRTLYFNVVYSDFSGLDVLSPTDGQSSLGLLPVFTWLDLPQADQYDFQLATSPDFEASTIIDEAFGLTEATYTPTVALTESNVYFWRIRPSNECGAADFTTPKAFQTFTVECAPFVSPDVPKNISAVGLPVVESILTILQNGIISDINVSQLKGSHDALAHIEVSLVSPAGTERLLFSQICGNVSQFNFGLNDESPFVIDCPPLNGLAYKPEQPLAGFIGENTLGDWMLKLAVVDAAGQGGTLEKWSIEFCASVTPNNPLLVHNDTIYVKPLETRLIHNFELAVEDADNPGNELQFTVADETDFGFISRDGVQLGIGDQFTMTDIHLQKITYTNTDPDAVYDFFTFIVEDGTGGWLGTPRLNIVIDENAVTGVKEPGFASSILLFPNPANNLLNVSFLQPVSGGGKVVVTDVQGRLVSQQSIAPDARQLKIGLSGFADGVYFLTVSTAGGVFAKKFVVQQ